MNETRNIGLPQGGMLEVEITPLFMNKVRAHFCLDENQHVDDDYVRMFIYGALKNALDKTEKE